MDKDNANPTVLSLAELPTRQKAQKIRRTGPETVYDSILFAKPEYLHFLAADRSTDGESDTSSHGDSEGSGPGSFYRLAGGEDGDADLEEPIDEQEIYDLVSPISDPEHPLTLGQLAVVNLADISIRPYATTVAPSSATSTGSSQLIQVLVKITPTITHCSLATVIGLAVRVRLEHALPPQYRVDVIVKENAHVQDDQVNKQLSDKERVAAALENQDLRALLDKMLSTCADV